MIIVDIINYGGVILVNDFLDEICIYFLQNCLLNYLDI